LQFRFRIASLAVLSSVSRILASEEEPSFTRAGNAVSGVNFFFVAASGVDKILSLEAVLSEERSITWIKLSNLDHFHIGN
jgi:hypothetical protein